MISISERNIHMTNNEIQKNSYEYWNSRFNIRTRYEIITDGWLDMFSKEINECNTPIIDLGCGGGNNTLYLINKGKTVIPCDFADSAIKQVKMIFPEITRAEQFDMLDGMPFTDGFTDIVVADLCLHYFTTEATHSILNEIKRILRPGGLLFARVNSVNDINHGAGKGVQIERNLYLTKDNRYKRFFDEQDIAFFFHGWNIVNVNEERMMRYKKKRYFGES
jgi:SAM-dependent methyltransferase